MGEFPGKEFEISDSLSPCSMTGNDSIGGNRGLPNKGVIGPILGESPNWVCILSQTCTKCAVRKDKEESGPRAEVSSQGSAWRSKWANDCST